MHAAVASVLAGIDLTPQGRRVIERARIIADAVDADLTLLHAIEPAPEAFLGDAVSSLMRTHIETSVESLGEWAQSRTERPITLRTLKGSPAWEIVRASKQADLTVVGSSSVDVARTGPVARRVAETSRTDVLIVKRQPRVAYRRVVVAVDLSEASRRAVERAMWIAPDADYQLVFSLPTRFDTVMADAGMFPEEIDLNRKRRLETAEAKMAEFAARWEGKVRTLVADGPPLETIEETVRRRSADLVVASSRGAGATRMVLLGTVVSGLLDAAPCDVAVARVPGDFRRP